MRHDGVLFWGPVDMRRGTTQVLDITRPVGAGLVDIYDADDPDPDDHIGETLELATELGSHSADFVRQGPRRTRAHYTLFYEILED